VVACSVALYFYQNARANFESTRVQITINYDKKKKKKTTGGKFFRNYDKQKKKKGHHQKYQGQISSFHL
jgi:hypothetical protein